jgi:hypothetical protein
MVNCLYTIVSEGCLLLGGRVYEPGSDIVSDFPQELKLPRSSPRAMSPRLEKVSFVCSAFARSFKLHTSRSRVEYSRHSFGQSGWWFPMEFSSLRWHNHIYVCFPSKMWCPRPKTTHSNQVGYFDNWKSSLLYGWKPTPPDGSTPIITIFRE